MKNDIILETLEEILDDSELTKKLMELKDISSVYKFFHSLNSSVTPKNLETWMETNMINNTNFNLNKLSSEDLECVAGGVNNTAAKATLLSAMMVLGNSGFLSNNTSNAAYQTNDSHYREVQKNKSKIEILKEFVLPTLPVMIPAGIAIGATGAYLIHQKYKKNNTNENRPDNPSNITSKNKNDRKVNNAVDAPFVGLKNSGNTCFANAYLQLLDSIYGSFAGDVNSILENSGSNDLERRFDNPINFIDEKLNVAKSNIKTNDDFREIYRTLMTFQGSWKGTWYTLLSECSFDNDTKNNILSNFWNIDKPLDCTGAGFAQNFKTIFLDSEEYYNVLKHYGCSPENIESIKKHARNLAPKLDELNNLHVRCENLKNQRMSLADDVINNDDWHGRARQLLNIFSRMHQNQKSGSIDVSDFTRNLQQSGVAAQEDPTEAFNKYLNLQTVLPSFQRYIAKENANNWYTTLSQDINLLGNSFLVSLNKNRINDDNAKNIKTTLPAEIVSENDKKYRLKGIVCHQGNSIHRGHYIAYRWDESSNSWWKCNDDSVTQEHRNILEDSTVRKTAYVLAYEKVNK